MNDTFQRGLCGAYANNTLKLRFIKRIDKMEEHIREIEQIATKYTESQSDGYSQIMRICDAMREQQKSCLGYISKEETASPQFDQT